MFLLHQNFDHFSDYMFLCSVKGEKREGRRVRKRGLGEGRKSEQNNKTKQNKTKQNQNKTKPKEKEKKRKTNLKSVMTYQTHSVIISDTSLYFGYGWWLWL